MEGSSTPSEGNEMKVVLGTMTFGGQTAASEAVEMLEVFAGHCQHKNVLELDTARLYQEGRTEDLLGSLGLSQEVQEVVSISSKANPFADSLSAERTKTQCLTSLSSLRVPQLDIFYLHGPDSSINIEETLAAVQELFEAGKFRRFGLSNFAAWEVVFVHGYMKERGWVTPSVYQGMYNVITRGVEAELFPALRKLGMAFYAFNPLAGGFLTGKYQSLQEKAILESKTAQATEDKFPAQETAEVADNMNYVNGRFDSSASGGRMYRKRYMNQEQFEAVGGLLLAARQELNEEAEEPSESDTLVSLAFSWLVHHSLMDVSKGDAVILGASRVEHLRSNLSHMRDAQPLPATMVRACDEAWRICACVCPTYHKGYSGSALQLCGEVVCS